MNDLIKKLEKSIDTIFKYPAPNPYMFNTDSAYKEATYNYNKTFYMIFLGISCLAAVLFTIFWVIGDGVEYCLGGTFGYIIGRSTIILGGGICIAIVKIPYILVEKINE